VPSELRVRDAPCQVVAAAAATSAPDSLRRGCLSTVVRELYPPGTSSLPMPLNCSESDDVSLNAVEHVFRLRCVGSDAWWDTSVGQVAGQRIKPKARVPSPLSSRRARTVGRYASRCSPVRTSVLRGH
jgi:hypothetical protein